MDEVLILSVLKFVKPLLHQLWIDFNDCFPHKFNWNELFFLINKKYTYTYF